MTTRSTKRPFGCTVHPLLWRMSVSILPLQYHRRIGWMKCFGLGEIWGIEKYNGKWIHQLVRTQGKPILWSFRRLFVPIHSSSFLFSIKYLYCVLLEELGRHFLLVIKKLIFCDSISIFGRQALHLWRLQCPFISVGLKCLSSFSKLNNQANGWCSYRGTHSIKCVYELTFWLYNIS